MLLALVLSTGAAIAIGEQRSNARACLSENAVYHATHHADGVPPDQLRLRFKDVDWKGYTALEGSLPRVIITSSQQHFELKLDPYFTNSSGVIGVSGKIPFEKLPKEMQESNRENHESALKDPEFYKELFDEEYTGQ